MTIADIPFPDLVLFIAAFQRRVHTGRGHDRRSVQRRMAAILAADVVGYSRLMGKDEENTLRPLRSIARSSTA